MSRRPIVLSAVVGLGLLAASALPNGPPLLLWNASASAPIGLYWLAPAAPIAVGDLVVVAPPERFAGFLAERGYLPRGVPLLKHVLALAGATVCRAGVTITIDGRVAGTALDRDRNERSLPVWRGCRTLADSDVFLMNPDVADSLDGRYFGPLPVSTIVARALPLWTDETGDGHFQWHIADRSGAP